MAIHIKEVLPMLETLLKQQGYILDRLRGMLDAFQAESPPIEPHLRAMLQPLAQDITEMQDVLMPNEGSRDSSASPSA